MSYIAICRSCGAEIVWVKLPNKKGEVKPHPVDKQPSEKGNIYVYHPGGDTAVLAGRYINQGEDWPPNALPRQSHFRTCPNAKQHRRNPT